MKHQKIKSVRMYKLHRSNYYDVIYHSGKMMCYLDYDLPKTVAMFVREATKRTHKYNHTLNRDEMIYEF